jgi:DNA-binding MarR family transcriptional regulator
MSTERDSIDAFLELPLAVFPDLDPRVEAIVDRLCHLQKRFDRLTEAGAAAFDLNTGEFRLLVKLRQVPGERLSAGALADLLPLSTGATTNRIDGLEAAGLVQRERDPSDRRGVIVTMTPKGRSVTDRAVTAIAASEQRVLGHLSPDDQDELNALLRRIMLAFEQGASGSRSA